MLVRSGAEYHRVTEQEVAVVFSRGSVDSVRFGTSETDTVVKWKRISEQHPPHSGELYLYCDTEGGYGVGVYETNDYFFEPGSGEVRAVWWAEFNKVEDE